MSRRATEAEPEHRRKIHGPAIARSESRIAGDGNPCFNTHDPQCRWPDCLCRDRDVLISGGELGRKPSGDKPSPFPRGGARPGSGPKPKHGEAMIKRSMRWTDADWADAKLVGTDRHRWLIRQDAARIRRLEDEELP